ncbi:MAG TPA: response regulator transcription factor [Acidimicrobiales bacterium]
MTVRVVVADDQEVVRAGFRALLELTDDLVVVGEAADGEDAVAQARALRPDVLLMDIRMPGVDGLEATRRIAADPHLAGVRVLVLTTFETDDHVFGALRAGASGFLLKDVAASDLYSAVRVVAAGQGTLAPSVTRRLIDAYAGRDQPGPVGAERLDVLTEREREVVRLVARGRSNDEIARELVMSPLTAKTHVSRAMTKLGARDRTQLAVIAYETGLARVGDP